MTQSYAQMGIDAPEPDFTREKGADWFQRQDEGTQRRMMGAAKWEAWQDGQFALEDMPKLTENRTWGDSWTPASLADLVGGAAQAPSDIWDDKPWLGKPGKSLGGGRLPTHPSAVDEWLSSGISGQWQDAYGEAIVGPEKDRIVSELSARTGVDYDRVNQFVHQWAESSNDNDMRSLAIQQDIAEVFGVNLAPWQQEKIDFLIQVRDRNIQRRIGRWGGTREEAIASYRQTVAGRRLFPLIEHDEQQSIIRAMYEHTQNQLNEAGFTDTIRLYRGMSLPQEMVTGWERGDNIEFVGNAAESWSQGYAVATDFGLAGAEVAGVRLVMDVPLERIIATAQTGFGCLGEGEFIVLGSIPGDISSIRGLISAYG